MKNDISGELILPSTITKIGNDAFDMCNFTSVKMHITTNLSLEMDIFDRNYNLTQLTLTSFDSPPTAI
jgi:hypothetical protein